MRQIVLRSTPLLFRELQIHTTVLRLFTLHTNRPSILLFLFSRLRIMMIIASKFICTINYTNFTFSRSEAREIDSDYNSTYHAYIDSMIQNNYYMFRHIFNTSKKYNTYKLALIYLIISN